MKAAAAARWVDAVNADGQFGEWAFRMVTQVSEVTAVVSEVARGSALETIDASPDARPTRAAARLSACRWSRAPRGPPRRGELVHVDPGRSSARQAVGLDGRERFSVRGRPGSTGPAPAAPGRSDGPAGNRAPTHPRRTDETPTCIWPTAASARSAFADRKRSTQTDESTRITRGAWAPTCVGARLSPRASFRPGRPGGARSRGQSARPDRHGRWPSFRSGRSADEHPPSRPFKFTWS